MAIRTDHIPPNPHLAVDVIGAGELVLFLHGIGGNRSNWAEQLAAVGAEFRGCAWDARGYGDSEDYVGPLRFADFRGDVLRVLDRFAARAAHLVGLSMGGMIAQDVFRCHPARVLSLTLADTRNAFQRFNNEDFLRRREAPLLAGKSPSDIAPGLAPTLASPHAEKRFIRRLEDSISALHKESYLKTLRAVTLCGDDPDFRGRPGFVELGSIGVPTLVVCGADDAVTPPDLSRSMAREIPNARLHIIPGAGHLTNIEKPAEFNAILLNFLRDASAAQRRTAASTAGSPTK